MRAAASDAATDTPLRASSDAGSRAVASGLLPHCSAITCQPDLRHRLLDATHIDRLNLGPVPTIQLNWRQPHEGNLIDFLFRARAFQTAEL